MLADYSADALPRLDKDARGCAFSLATGGYQHTACGCGIATRLQSTSASLSFLGSILPDSSPFPPAQEWIEYVHISMPSPYTS